MFNVLSPPVVNVRGGKRTVVGGHQRLSVLKEEGYTTVDCLVVDFSPDEEKAANLTLNNVAIQGAFDPLQAVKLLSEAVLPALPTPDFAQFDSLMADMQKEQRKLDRLSARVAPIELAPDDEVDSVTGTAYRLGRHLLYCGAVTEALPSVLLPKRKMAGACIVDLTTSDLPVQEENWQAFCSLWSLCRAKVKENTFVLTSPVDAASVWSAVESGLRCTPILSWFILSNPLRNAQFRTQACNVIHAPGEGVKPLPLVEVGVGRTVQESVTNWVKERLACYEEGSTILDPVADSGAVLLACELAGCNAVSCTADPARCDAIRKQWAQTVHGQGADWRSLTVSQV